MSTSVVLNRKLTNKERAFKEIGYGSALDNITVLACRSAIGEVMPPYAVYKAQTHDQDWTNDGPVNARYISSSSGWMEEAQFTNGHGFHIDIDIATKERQENVIHIILPSTAHNSDTSAVRCVFAAVKKTWGRIFKNLNPL